ncbi:GGDEF domain-containing protein [Kineosporia succinea]|uniref:Diguanylate cyclase (GGDEF)-like protein n=1 Tax=Kineosporia succinea TaxID=84632 RepID=A0ABT9PFJ2_9ACTN|nr:GGDEF domain-containing protein [Kineosporia succinea]MDP9831256.1 diguanylate cyclase (GGDEF)-like protein [Kineosporia succinea]
MSFSATTWLVLHYLDQPQASFGVTMLVWTACLVLYAAPVQSWIVSRTGGDLRIFLVVAGTAIWCAASTTYLPSMFPMLMGIATVELAERDSSWRTAGFGLAFTLVGTGLMEWCVQAGLVPSIFRPDDNHHLSVILALFGSVLIVRGLGRARQSAALRRELAHEQARRHEELRHAATHDALTGMLSRRGLSDALAGPIRNAPGLAVVYLDLDGFKAVNDQHGHAVGDALLVEVALRFEDAVPAPGVLARMGGDEFVAVVPGFASHEEAFGFAALLQDCLDQPFEVQNPDSHRAVPVAVGVSVGVSWSAGPDRDPDALMREADKGMYEDKRAGAAARTTGLPLPSVAGY